MAENKLESDIERIEAQRSNLNKNYELMEKTGELDEVRDEKPEQFNIWDDTRRRTKQYYDLILATHKRLEQKGEIKQTEEFIEKARKAKDYDIFAELDWGMLQEEGRDTDSALKVLKIPPHYYDSQFKANPVRLMLEIEKTGKDQREFLKDKSVDMLSNVMLEDQLKELKEKYGTKVTQENFWTYVIPFVFDLLDEDFGSDPPRSVALMKRMRRVFIGEYSSFSQSIQSCEAEMFLQYKNIRGDEKYIKNLVAERTQFEDDTAAGKLKADEIKGAIEFGIQQYQSLMTSVDFLKGEESRTRERVVTLNKEIGYLESRLGDVKKGQKLPQNVEGPSMRGPEEMAKVQRTTPEAPHEEGREEKAEETPKEPIKEKKEAKSEEKDATGQVSYKEGDKEYVVRVRRNPNGTHVRFTKDGKAAGVISEDRFEQIKKMLGKK